MTIWDLITAFRDETGASEAWIMRKAGLNKGAFAAWRARGVPVLPDRRDLLGLAETLRVDYERVVIAMLHAGRYLPEAVARDEVERLDAEAQDRVDVAVLAGRVVSEILGEAASDFDAAHAMARERYQRDEYSLGVWEVVDGQLREIERQYREAKQWAADELPNITPEDIAARRSKDRPPSKPQD